MTVAFANFATLPAGAYIDIGYATWSPASTWAFNGGYSVTDYITQISSGTIIHSFCFVTLNPSVADL
jgi:hypothetical protein